MRELLSAEFYKLYKSLGFRVCLIVFFVQDIIYLISVGLVGDILGIELTGDFQFQYLLGSFSGSSVSGMLFGFIAASLITSDYKSRDIQCAIAQGHSRAHIMFSKIIVYIVAIWILSLEDILVYTIGGCICGGFGKAFTVQKPAALDYSVGDRVRHIKFGEGTVLSVKDGTKDFEVSVNFDTAGVKKMFASFAKLQKL